MSEWCQVFFLLINTFIYFVCYKPFFLGLYGLYWNCLFYTVSFFSLFFFIQMMEILILSMLNQFYKNFEQMGCVKPVLNIV